MKIEINLANLLHNLSVVRQLAPDSKILAMIKADAYGHGLIPVAQALATQVAALGVARLSEVLELRQANIKTPLIVMSGLNGIEELKVMSELNCGVVIHSEWQLKLLAQLELLNPLQVWLKINTGMNRLGFAIDQVQQVYQKLMALPHIQKPLVLMTHFSDADNPSNLKTKQQCQRFDQSVTGLKAELSYVNSAAIISLPEKHADWVRPGLMLYGASPLQNKTAAELGLKPVMTVRAPIIAIHDLQPGDEIGYGSTWRCPETMRVAIVAIGYGDGYPRHAKSGTPVLVNGQQCPLIGTISMDMLAVDLRSVEQVAIGDEVVLWGDGLPVELVAEAADSISYELFTHMAPRTNKTTYIQ